jgi:hypothetical protein
VLDHERVLARSRRFVSGCCIDRFHRHPSRAAPWRSLAQRAVTRATIDAFREKRN